MSAPSLAPGVRLHHDSEAARLTGALQADAIASGSHVLIHGVLALQGKVTPPDGADLQDGNIPMPDDSWAIERVWGGEEGHRMYLEAPLSSGSKSLKGPQFP